MTFGAFGLDLMFIFFFVIWFWILIRVLMDLVPNHRVVPQPLITLRSKHGMKMVAERR